MGIQCLEKLISSRGKHKHTSLFPLPSGIEFRLKMQPKFLRSMARIVSPPTGRPAASLFDSAGFPNVGIRA
jgi:hypothetical protein